MEKAIVIPVNNRDGSLTLEEYISKVPPTIRMRIKPSFLRDKTDSPIGSHVIIPVQLLASYRGLTSNTAVIQVEKFYGTDKETEAWLGGRADTRENAVKLLNRKFGTEAPPQCIQLLPVTGVRIQAGHAPSYTHNRRSQLSRRKNTRGEKLLRVNHPSGRRSWLRRALDNLQAAGNEHAIQGRNKRYGLFKKERDAHP